MHSSISLPVGRHPLTSWLALVLAVSACHTAPATARPAPPTWAAELQTRVAAFQRESGLAGVNLAVSLADGRVVTAAAGQADRETGEPLRPEHRMLAGSVGKTYAVALLLQLVAAGRLGLDDPVAGFFADAPWYARLANAEDLTVRRLANHTSGLPRWVFQPALWQALGSDPDRRWTGAERLALILDLAPVHAAGEAFAYSDSNYILLGMIVERIAGHTYEDLLRQRIAAPLGLTRTTPSDRRALDGLAAGYTKAENPFGLPAKVAEGGVYAVNPQFEWTGGGVITTAGDLARWARALYAGDVLSPAMRAQMVEPSPFPTKLPGAARYGLGAIVRSTDLGPAHGHDGFMPGYVTSMSYYPQVDLAIAVQVNEDSTTGKHARPLAGFAHEIARWLATDAQATAEPAD